MKQTKQALVYAITAAGCLGSISIQGAEPAQLMIDAGPCVLLENASRRYACYEQQVEAALNGSAAASQAPPAASSGASVSETAVAGTAAAVAGAAATSGTASSAEDDFGFPEPEAEEEKAVEELHSVISELEETVPNQHLITLENGQVWRQTRPDSRFRMRSGHHVRVYPTRWGDDYRMSVEELRGYIQVERVQ